MRVAEKFCYEFCLAVGVMWTDTKFLFTAYKGSAASLIGGVTISKAAYLNLQRQNNKDDINEWKDVRILVIDEVSFMSDSIFKKLNRQLTKVGNRTKSFGGLSIIFAGDFRQLDPICSKESAFLFSSKSSKEWDSNINAIIILDNEHYFKEDPEYGKMLKRILNGDLTLEDKQRINTRVIGDNGPELPSMLQGKYKIIQV
jgi:ATP-dependent DNA helicase PIF1